MPPKKKLKSKYVSQLNMDVSSVTRHAAFSSTMSEFAKKFTADDMKTDLTTRLSLPTLTSPLPAVPTTTIESLSTMSTIGEKIMSDWKNTELKTRPPLPALGSSTSTTSTITTTTTTEITSTSTSTNTSPTITSSLQTGTTCLNEKSLKSKSHSNESKGNELHTNKKHSKKLCKNKRKNKQDNILIIMLGTNKNHRTVSDVDFKYCQALNYVNKDYLPDSWVGYVVIKYKVPLITYINDNKNDKAFQDWVKNCQYFRHKNDSTMTIFDDFSAYMIAEYKEFAQPVKITHSIHQRQYRMYFESNDATKKTLNQIRNKNLRLNELEKTNDLIYMGLIVSTPMIGLMLSGKKKAEFRKTSLTKEISVKKTFSTGIKLAGPPVVKKKKYTKEVPTRKDIKITKRESQKPLINAALKQHLSRYYINWNDLSCPIMHDFSRDKVKSFFTQWIFVKDIHIKNENKSIKEHNDKLIKYMDECFSRLSFWNKDILCQNEKTGNANYYLLQNFLVILFGFPDKMNQLLLMMKDQYQHLFGILAHILGFISKPECRHCQSKVRYRYSTKRRPKYGWICQNKGCRKENSCWANTCMQEFKCKKLNDIFATWFSIFSGISQKQFTSEGVVSKDRHKNIKKHLTETLNIYVQHNYIVLGDGNKHCFFDHTFKGVKRKYLRGYIKNKKWLLFGGTDKNSLFVLQIVDSEKKIETNHYIKKYSTPDSLIDTDCGGAFNDVAHLDQRRHRTVNHSGTKDPKTGIVHYFKCPITGVDTNSIEALFSRLVNKFIIKYPNDLKKLDTFVNGIALFDFRYNRTNNYAQQLFINALMAYNEVHNPLQGEPLKIIPREDFTNIYEVEKIISDRPSTRREKDEREFLIHWKGYALHQSSWHHLENLIRDPDNVNSDGNLRIIEEYDLLSDIDKQNRINAYNKSVSLREKKEIEKNAIPMLTMSKFEKFLRAQSKRNAIEIILKDGVINVHQNIHPQKSELDTKIIKVSALIASQKSLDLVVESEKHEYNVNVVFHDGTPVEWRCECLAHKQLLIQNKNFMCKHCIVVMLELSVEGQRLIAKHRQNQSSN